MKKSLIILLVPMIWMGCAKTERSAKLAVDSPAYATAQKLAEKVPYMNPDVNNDLVKAKGFAITSGDVALFVQQNMGPQIDQIATLESEQVKNLVKNVARTLSERKLLLVEAKSRKFACTPAELDSLCNIYAQSAGSEALLTQQLEENGMSLSQFRTEVNEGLVRQKFLQDVVADVPETATDSEIQEAYDALLKNEKASVRHILLLTQDKSEKEKAAIRRKMEGILRRAKRGEDFAILANTYTEDPGSKDNGGLYENFGRGEMVKPFEDAAFSVPVGEISDIVETRYGYHILKVVDRHGETKSLEEIKPQIEQQIVDRKKTQRIQELISELKLKRQVTQVEF